MANSNKTYGRNYRVYRPRNTRTVEVELPSMPRKTTSLPPILIIVFGFLLLVLIGTILLSMPFAYADGMPQKIKTDDKGRDIYGYNWDKSRILVGLSGPDGVKGPY